MKIRSYKGPSLEKLYAAIQRELGPEAVVVSSQKSKGLKGLMKGCRHELVAVVDDASSENHLAGTAGGSPEVKAMLERQESRFAEMEDLFRSFRSEMLGTSAAVSETHVPLDQGGIPEFAMDWDPRFLMKVRKEAPEILENPESLQARQKMASLINVREDYAIPSGARQPHVVVLAGPTGCGKTTTFAKLAASWCLDHSLKVGLITMDTYRVAAVDQAREYASLLGLDLKVVFSATEASRAVQSFSDRDVIIVDTPGRSYYDQSGIMALRGMLSGMGDLSLMLLVPAALSRPGVRDLVERFGVLEPDGMIVTKTDEARDLSVVSVLASETNRPITFMTNGQRVPQDIKPASYMDIVDGMIKI